MPQPGFEPGTLGLLVLHSTSVLTGIDMKMRSNQNYKVLCMYFDVIFTVFCCILGLWNYELRKKKLRFFWFFFDKLDKIALSWCIFRSEKKVFWPSSQWSHYAPKFFLNFINTKWPLKIISLLLTKLILVQLSISYMYLLQSLQMLTNTHYQWQWVYEAYPILCIKKNYT